MCLQHTHSMFCMPGINMSLFIMTFFMVILNKTCLIFRYLVVHVSVQRGHPRALLRGTIVNRTYGTHRHQYIYVFLLLQYLVLFTMVPRKYDQVIQVCLRTQASEAYRYQVPGTFHFTYTIDKSKVGTEGRYTWVHGFPFVSEAFLFRESYE